MASRDPARSRRHSRRRRSPTSSEEATSPADANTGEALADGPAAPANIPATDPASQFREAHADRLDSLRGALVARAAKGTDRSTGSAARRSPSRGRGVRRRRAREKAEPRDQVQCPVCGTKCHAQGLEQHQLYSAYCKGQRDRWAGWMQCLACLSWHGSDEAFEQHCQAKHPERAILSHSPGRGSGCEGHAPAHLACKAAGLDCWEELAQLAAPAIGGPERGELS